MKSEQVVSPILPASAPPFQVQVAMAGEKKTEESSKKKDQVEVPKGQGAFAASSGHDAVAVALAGRMMGSFGARTNLIRKQVQYPGGNLVELLCFE